ncbi:putative ABC transporter (ATP binding and permease domain) [Bradyrhizobium sp. ORS 285]|uniref:ABC transporter transmembrane domain-containing protein n=1 Tax=Bradyrhizobium sp. ORS 285 TaxID=115808 RepID=UPI0002406D9E|nr:ABC transporter transmembrane domain-containing protein [Bradyrhizobium sp. ORS 285]CCD87871.1 putative ABC transporter (ATP binding and permease domain) [Bradyrhizobium sp. ORS 285]SMX61043.1 putative ABC transporter (ATP binding and permease domain) [Bradyrhizobium sp. ORS 285]
MTAVSERERRRIGFNSTLVAMTLALNVLGLCVPLTAQIIFNRILPNPNTTTLPVIVFAALAVTLLESLLRLARTFLAIEETLKYNQTLVSAAFEKLVRAGAAETAKAGAAQAIVYFGRVGQVAEDFGGKTAIALAELAFVPLILALIFYISPLSGIAISISVVIGLSITAADGRKMNRLARIVSRKTERRYSFLLGVLGAIHSIKAIGVEGRIARQYEVYQADLARYNYKMAIKMGRLMNGISASNQSLTVVALLCGAYGVAYGSMTIGAVAAVILLAGRLMGPLQRVVFILIQARDLCESRNIIVRLLARESGRAVAEREHFVPAGRLDAANLGFRIESRLATEHYAGLDLQLNAGDFVAISGRSEEALASLLRILAGVQKPEAGVVNVDGRPVEELSFQALNASIALVTSSGAMLKGTIRDNITRFGQVTVEQALGVAGMLGVDRLINELPQGIETPLLGEIVEAIPASLCQQIAIVRALAHRPRVILLDNVDRGLDQLAYANLHRFLARISGRATVVLVSDDKNLTGGASRHYHLRSDGLELDRSKLGEQLVTYRGLKL